MANNSTPVGAPSNWGQPGPLVPAQPQQPGSPLPNPSAISPVRTPEQTPQIQNFISPLKPQLTNQDEPARIVPKPKKNPTTPIQSRLRNVNNGGGSSSSPVSAPEHTASPPTSSGEVDLLQAAQEVARMIVTSWNEPKPHDESMQVGLKGESKRETSKVLGRPIKGINRNDVATFKGYLMQIISHNIKIEKKELDIILSWMKATPPNSRELTSEEMTLTTTQQTPSLFLESIAYDRTPKNHPHHFSCIHQLPTDERKRQIPDSPPHTALDRTVIETIEESKGALETFIRNPQETKSTLYSYPIRILAGSLQSAIHEIENLNTTELSIENEHYQEAVRQLERYAENSDTFLSGDHKFKRAYQSFQVEVVALMNDKGKADIPLVNRVLRQIIDALAAIETELESNPQYATADQSNELLTYCTSSLETHKNFSFGRLPLIFEIYQLKHELLHYAFVTLTQNDVDEAKQSLQRWAVGLNSPKVTCLQTDQHKKTLGSHFADSTCRDSAGRIQDLVAPLVQSMVPPTNPAHSLIRPDNAHVASNAQLHQMREKDRRGNNLYQYDNCFNYLHISQTTLEKPRGEQVEAIKRDLKKLKEASDSVVGADFDRWYFERAFQLVNLYCATLSQRTMHVPSLFNQVVDRSMERDVPRVNRDLNLSFQRETDQHSRYTKAKPNYVRFNSDPFKHHLAITDYDHLMDTMRSSDTPTFRETCVRHKEYINGCKMGIANSIDNLKLSKEMTIDKLVSLIGLLNVYHAIKHFEREQGLSWTENETGLADKIKEARQFIINYRHQTD